ncbi:bifunctional DNA primase/helicase [Geminicoccus harenae]|uniref:bifunctional DNA primase/helicase n=1 Tax=Geminicoccus harenae TaxID=2498453 RepID=UPI00168B5EFD|nr:bifunctional DNA primase/helicase [Geminicoccus harenae]
MIITEGELDAIAAMQAGFRRVVSVPGGAPSKEVASDTSGKYAFVADTLKLFEGVRDIVIASDGDEPGVALLNDLSLRLGKGRCRYVQYRHGTKDLNDLLLGYGQAAVIEAINGAPHVHVAGLFRMSDYAPIPMPTAMACGFDFLVDNYRVRLGDFVVATGVPGMGKTTFVNDLVVRMAENYGLSTCFASFEQHPLIDHRRSLRRLYARCPESRMRPEEIADADRWIDGMFSFVTPDEDEDATLEWVLDKLAASVVRYGTQICVIDPWNELDHVRPKDMSLTEYVGWAIRQLRKFARKWQVHLIVVAHPAKMMRDRDGKVGIPSLYDISDSAHWFNKPDVGIVVHRDADGDVIRIAKSRYHDIIGKPTTVKVHFDAYTGRYSKADAL